MFNILNWNFRNSTSVAEGIKNRINFFPSGSRRGTMVMKKSECVLVQVMLCRRSSDIVYNDFIL